MEKACHVPERQGTIAPFARGDSQGPSAVGIFLRLIAGHDGEQSCPTVFSFRSVVGCSGRHSRRQEMHALFQQSAAASGVGRWKHPAGTSRNSRNSSQCTIWG